MVMMFSRPPARVLSVVLVMSHAGGSGSRRGYGLREPVSSLVDGCCNGAIVGGSGGIGRIDRLALQVGSERVGHVLCHRCLSCDALREHTALFANISPPLDSPS